MENNFATFNIVILSASIYSLCVYLTLQPEEYTRIYVYRFLTALFVILMVTLNYPYVKQNLLQIYEKLLKKLKDFFGITEETVKEDKVRTFVE